MDIYGKHYRGEMDMSAKQMTVRADDGTELNVANLVFKPVVKHLSGGWNRTVLNSFIERMDVTLQTVEGTEYAVRNLAVEMIDA
jgi:hypothetical protein